MFSKRDAEFEARIKAVAVHFADIIIYARRAQHRTRDTGIDREVGRKDADVLRATDHHFVAHDELFQVVDEVREAIDDLFRALHPARWRVAPATTKTHVVAHHA